MFSSSIDGSIHVGSVVANPEKSLLSRVELLGVEFVTVLLDPAVEPSVNDGSEPFLAFAIALLNLATIAFSTPWADLANGLRS